MTVEFEWDEEKNWSNDAKHGLGFEIAALVFEDPEAVSFLDDRFDFGEKRWVTLGRIDFAIIYVAHTVEEDDDGEEIIRIVSARQTTAREKRIYLSR